MSAERVPLARVPHYACAWQITNHVHTWHRLPCKWITFEYFIKQEKLVWYNEYMCDVTEGICGELYYYSRFQTMQINFEFYIIKYVNIYHFIFEQETKTILICMAKKDQLILLLI